MDDTGVGNSPRNDASSVCNPDNWGTIRAHGRGYFHEKVRVRMVVVMLQLAMSHPEV